MNEDYLLAKKMDFVNFGNICNRKFYVCLFFKAVKDCVDPDKFKEIEKSYKEKINDVDNIKIKDTCLDNHIQTVLSYANIHTLGDYLRRHDGDLLRIKGFGVISLRKIKEYIAMKGWLAIFEE